MNMSRPQGNGLVELHDAKLDRNEFFCMDLVGFLSNDETRKIGNWDDWHERWTQAKNGNCPYRDTCPQYERTMAKRIKKGMQFELFD